MMSMFLVVLSMFCVCNIMTIKQHSILFYSILFYSILFYSTEVTIMSAGCELNDNAISV